jgi:hypothetical protein
LPKAYLHTDQWRNGDEVRFCAHRSEVPQALCSRDAAFDAVGVDSPDRGCRYRGDDPMDWVFLLVRAYRANG